VRRFVVIAIFAVLVLACFGSTAGAVSLESVGSFQQPISITSDPENSDRLLIAEREGSVIEVEPGGSAPFADFSSLVSCCESERGLLSIALGPDFSLTGRFYAAYTGTPAAGGAEGDVHVDSFRRDPSSPGQLLHEPIISIGHALNPNHNGGQLQFGPDGHLYISLGDGGGGGDPDGNGQDTESLLGKILRIDPHPGQQPAYTVPPGNPFVGGTGLDQIWAYGLRNPWRFSFDRVSGDMVIADVGQGAREEVDFAPSPAAGAVAGAGANYGWNCREGFIAYPTPAAECASLEDFAEPVFDYPHVDPGGNAAFGCSIIGGFVVRDPSLTELYGRYVYSDYCTWQIRSLILPSEASGRASGDRSEQLTVAKPTSFGEDSCGRVYVASDEGPVYRLVGAAPAECPTSGPPDVPGAPGGAASPAGGRTRLPRVVKADQGVLVNLRAQKTRAGMKIFTSVSPCAEHAGDAMQLNRGGKRLAVKRLSRDCTAGFSTSVDGRATFRALLRGDPVTRSKRLVVDASRRSR
jgi:hypothetical protein